MKLNPASKYGYNICTALRGPDFYDLGVDLLKAITTGYIRHLVGVRHFGFVNSFDQVRAEWALNKGMQDHVRRLTQSSKALHFVAHFRTALDSLNTRPKLRPAIKEYCDWATRNNLSYLVPLDLDLD